MVVKDFDRAIRLDQFVVLGRADSNGLVSRPSRAMSAFMQSVKVEDLLTV
jgi:hypothetical protein